ncbi:hypothetical protein ACS0TY_003654 [Phlomoides rotata]
MLCSMLSHRLQHCENFHNNINNLSQFDLSATTHLMCILNNIQVSNISLKK